MKKNKRAKNSFTNWRKKAMKEETKKERKVNRIHTAMERAQTVLALWTEKARPSQLSRELGVNVMVIQQWQDRALEGMLQALEPRTNLAQGSALSPRLQTLLARREMKQGVNRLERRLESLNKKREKKDTETPEE
jgi:hypothetical protein